MEPIDSMNKNIRIRKYLSIVEIIVKIIATINSKDRDIMT